MEKRQELKKALSEGKLYDFISNNGYKFDSYELIEIIKNLSFSIYEMLGEDTSDNVEKRTIENLKDVDFFEED